MGTKIAKLQTGARTDIGLVRQANQDSYHVGPVGNRGYFLLAVADGMGGYAGGEVASRLAIESIGQAIAGPGPWDADPVDPSSIREALVRAFEQANERVFQAAEHLPEYRGMGTTLTAILIPPGPGRPVVLCHVGDSRAYRLSDGRARQLTDDHSFVGELLKNGDLTEAEAMTHPHRNILTKALGTDDHLPVDSGTIEAVGGDTFVICSDGLSSLVAQDEVAAAINASDDLQAALDQLVELAKKRGGPDNITVVAARLSAGEGGR
ncbi:MAG: Stp1/IreP family PP2C-type Ser/Thr phosphatase [Bacillota bacterium]